MQIRRIAGIPFIKFGNRCICVSNISSIKFKDGSIFSSPYVEINFAGRYVDCDDTKYSEDTDVYKYFKKVLESDIVINEELEKLEPVKFTNKTSQFPSYTHSIKDKH